MFSICLVKFFKGIKQNKHFSSLPISTAEAEAGNSSCPLTKTSFLSCSITESGECVCDLKENREVKDTATLAVTGL